MKEVKCPSGATLKISLSPFKDAKALYQAVLKEAKEVSIKSDEDLQNIFKNVFCGAFSSQEIENCLEVCLKRCTYNSGNGDLKIDENTFEPEAARDDYIVVVVAVMKENIFPFVKSLYAEYKNVLLMMQNIQS